MRNLTIDPEFRDKIPPLSEDEFKKLEENILSDREVREPLVLWNNTIIDGHHRWQIIQKHPEIPYKVKQMEFADKWEAIAWICSNQLGRRNLTDEQKTYLLGKQFEAQKKAQGGDRKSKRQNGALNNEPKGKTSIIIAKQHGVGQKTVERSEHFAKGLDEADKVSPGIKDAVLSGEVKAPKKVIAEIRNMDEEKKEKVVDAIAKGDKAALDEIIKPSYIPMPNATPVEPAPPYDLDDFKQELEAIGRNSDACYKQTLVLAHREMLNTEEGREVAMKVLLQAHKSIEKYENMINLIKGGASNDQL